MENNTKYRKIVNNVFKFVEDMSFEYIRKLLNIQIYILLKKCKKKDNENNTVLPNIQRFF
jgi:hypothetical protein